VTDDGARTSVSGESAAQGRRAALGVEGPLVLAAVSIGLNYVAIKYAVGSIPPLLVGALRFALGGLVLWGALRLLAPGTGLRRGSFWAMLGIGLVGGTLFNAALNEGMLLTSASNSALIMATAPVWGMLLAAALKVERLTAMAILGAGVSLVGVGLVLGGGFEGSGSSLLGDLLVLVAAVSFGAYSVLSRLQQRHDPPLAIATYTTFLGGLALFLLTPAELARWDWAAVGIGAWAAVAYLVLFSTALGYGVWQWGISRIGANKVLVYLYLITLVGVLSSVVLLGEDFGPVRVLGALIILVGVYLSRRR